MAEFGENLKNVREQKGYTQQTLADHLYVTRQAVSRWQRKCDYRKSYRKKRTDYLIVSGVYEFAGKRTNSPVPLYVTCVIYGTIGIIIFITGLFSGKPMHDVYRNYLMDSVFSLLANLVILALLVVMAYTLHRKRKLSVQ